MCSIIRSRIKALCYNCWKVRHIKTPKYIPNEQEVATPSADLFSRTRRKWKVFVIINVIIFRSMWHTYYSRIIFSFICRNGRKKKFLLGLEFHIYFCFLCFLLTLSNSIAAKLLKYFILKKMAPFIYKYKYRKTEECYDADNTANTTIHVELPQYDAR